MFRVEANEVEDTRAERDAEEAFSNLAKKMKAVVDVAAAYERANKTYQDRTGTLRKETQGRIETNRRNEAEVVLEMDTYYASYVVARGFSAIAQAERAAELAMDDLFDRLDKETE